MSDLLGHVPVLSDEVARFFQDLPAGWVVDCTLGLGGHSSLLLRANPRIQVLGLDVDESNLATANGRLAEFGDRFRSVQSNFGDLAAVLADGGSATGPVVGIMADLGVSSNQISDPLRGLSFDVDGPLDMRLDRRQKTTAADLVNTLGEGELSDLIYLQAQERHSRRIAKRICQVRRQIRLNSTVQLARLVATAMGEDPDSHRSRIHPATRTFMALRMAVNGETQALGRLLEAAPRCLSIGGRIAVISFHSVEDRAVKENFKAMSAAGTFEVLTKKPLTATEEEQAVNPRSRSAKLRVARRVA
ncbi:Ribosomal RNA small subunit methyltransferase H [Phycisphaerae bacterium RAS2]|nr:Ribosomal RNA small subunit methyltransferase H [Phycisphaerae bacterium RAS2]